MPYGDYQAGNRGHSQWRGPGRGYGSDQDFDWGAMAQAEGFRGLTALEIVLVRKLGNKVTLRGEDFARIQDFVVVRVEEPDGSVTLAVREKTDARGATVDLVRQPGGSYTVDEYAGL